MACAFAIFSIVQEPVDATFYREITDNVGLKMNACFKELESLQIIFWDSTTR